MHYDVLVNECWLQGEFDVRNFCAVADVEGVHVRMANEQHTRCGETIVQSWEKKSSVGMKKASKH